jgi:anhydro-N-acetylmuramic acid kinase
MYLFSGKKVHLHYQMDGTKNQTDVLGIMSGTSLDGLDLALCRFSENSTKYAYRILHAETVPIQENWKTVLKNPFVISGMDLAGHHLGFGSFLGETALHFLKKNNLNASLIASHGHTLYHEPQRGLTFQLGHGAAIAHTSGIDTVSDFRSGDVALGGQGAPLVPVGDEYLFGEFDACLNLGGFANISMKNPDGKRIGFDIVPCNFVLNRLAGRLNADYDEGGKMASHGSEILELTKALNGLDYYRAGPPKSLGAEWTEQHVLPLLSAGDTHQLLHTFTLHIAWQIANIINTYRLKNVLVTGGGAKNDFLMEEIRKRTSAEICKPDTLTVDFKESLIFAFLGYLRMQGKNNVWASVTGARRDSCAGAFYKAGVIPIY